MPGRQLQRAIENGEFVLHYQARVAVASGRLLALEALLRWRSPGLSPVSPGELAALAHDSGLADPLGDWVPGVACRQAKRWRGAGFAHGITLSVRVSTRQFRLGDLPLLASEVLAQTRLEPAALELAIAETSLMEYEQAAIDTIRRLKAIGVQIAIDAFGDGYSSLDYLDRFAPDSLMIERSFIAQMVDDAELAAILGIIALRTHAGGRKLVAKGVETEAQLRLLQDMGFDAYQGELLGPASPADELVPLLANLRAPRL